MSLDEHLFWEARRHVERFERLYLHSFCLWLRPRRRRRIYRKTLPMAWRRANRRRWRLGGLY